MNIMLGYITLFFILLLLFLYPLRIWNKNSKLYFYIRKYHQWFAFCILILAFIHGILSGKQTGMISGKIAWTVLLLMYITCLCLKKWKYRKLFHHIFMFVFLILCISHIILLW